MKRKAEVLMGATLMSLVKCMEIGCADIIESTDQKACLRHARHHGKSYKEICWELVTEETTDAINGERRENKTGNGQKIWSKKGETGLFCQ